MNMKNKSTLFTNFKRDKGVAGLTILLSVVAMIFIIGFLVMIFAVIGGQLQNSASDPTDATVLNETGAWLNSSSYTVDEADAAGFRSFAVTQFRGNLNAVVNATYPMQVVNAANYTYTGAGVLTNATSQVWFNGQVDYTYVYDANTTANAVISDTTSAIATVPEWFPIIITITVMVALILLTVIIIVAIRASGILANGQ